MAKEKVQQPQAEVTEKPLDVQAMVNELAAKAKVALDEYMKLDQEQIDKIAHAMALAGLDKHTYLAKLAVEETGRGVYEDKIIKNLFATEYIWHDIKSLKTVGVIDDNELEGIVQIAEPVGIIAGVTPVTNPTSTTMFKAIIAAKTRNPIIFGFHPSAQKCSVEAAKAVRDAAIANGAPENCIQWIEFPSIEATNALMNHPEVAMVLATGGAGMVRSAYSTGKPALGVGPGNVPCYIEKSANVERSCNDLILSKTFDNGMICASEQAVIVDKDIQAKFESYMKSNNCHFCNEEETKKLEDYAFQGELKKLRNEIVGKPATWIAANAGIQVAEGTKILIARIPDVGPDYVLSKEKLSPILAYIVVDGHVQGFEMAKKMLENGGLGHSAAIHCTDEEIVRAYGEQMKVGRVIVNSPSSQGGIGDIYNENTPSLTLGCGSFGKNSTTQNVSAMNLVNVKRIAKRRVNMQWFKVPPKIYFEFNAVQYLEKMPDISRAFIVTDPMMVQLGYVDKVLYYLRKRSTYCHSEIFSDVEPDPSVETIMRGVEAMNQFKPDVIIALGGGSAMTRQRHVAETAASRHAVRRPAPEVPRHQKRTFHFPKLGEKRRWFRFRPFRAPVRVTSFSVITDKPTSNIRLRTRLTPDVAIIDPQFVMTMPRSITADTGMDVLTHAIEAYVSVLASDYTDGLALQAIKLVFEYLPRAYKDGTDKEARQKMHNASCMAGMAFTNAFLGLNHSMAHKIGGEYHVPHGRANAILLPYVIEYNAEKPTKFATWPKYEKFIADQRYAEIAKTLGLPAATTEQGVKSLVKAIRDLMKELNEPFGFKDCGIDEKVFMENLMELSDNAKTVPR
ncbi:MAG: bifunctional acetaldehyde-CoA/alcohol dehydrogenase [Oscillospiraceae bacterium]